MGTFAFPDPEDVRDADAVIVFYLHVEIADDTLHALPDAIQKARARAVETGTRSEGLLAWLARPLVPLDPLDSRTICRAAAMAYWAQRLADDERALVAEQPLDLADGSSFTVAQIEDRWHLSLAWDVLSTGARLGALRRIELATFALVEGQVERQAAAG